METLLEKKLKSDSDQAKDGNISCSREPGVQGQLHALCCVSIAAQTAISLFEGGLSVFRAKLRTIKSPRDSPTVLCLWMAKITLRTSSYLFK